MVHYGGAYYKINPYYTIYEGPRLYTTELLEISTASNEPLYRPGKGLS